MHLLLHIFVLNKLRTAFTITKEDHVSQIFHKMSEMQNASPGTDEATGSDIGTTSSTNDSTTDNENTETVDNAEDNMGTCSSTVTKSDNKEQGVDYGDTGGRYDKMSGKYDDITGNETAGVVDNAEDNMGTWSSTVAKRDIKGKGVDYRPANYNDDEITSVVDKGTNSVGMSDKNKNRPLRSALKGKGPDYEGTGSRSSGQRRVSWSPEVGNGGLSNGGLSNGGLSNGGLSNGGLSNGGLSNGGPSRGGRSGGGPSNAN
ncbi:hypothetical protein B0T10DRAFT_457317 [Thelonectria olida]|uniref:Uncharacterized protein n=1 Tax=Thelonectria olida TaxID=1576542 RepID=A0A9P9AS95_9HYPO|nr:hypothetical protein B0T10DRAFT_457317 [Thelonectria olida]